jgi:hypothetical protein
MNQIKLYFDEDALQSALVIALKNANVDVVTVGDINRFGFSDEDQLIWAAEQQRVIYSFNMGDFHQLHSLFLAEARVHSGIILVPQQRYSIGEQRRGLLRLINQRSAESLVSQLIFLSAYIN